MWIVKLALNKPYTFIVASILILVLGFASIATTPTDIFPNIDIPVVTVIWSYSGALRKRDGAARYHLQRIRPWRSSMT